MVRLIPIVLAVLSSALLMGSCRADDPPPPQCPNMTLKALFPCSPFVPPILGDLPMSDFLGLANVLANACQLTDLDSFMGKLMLQGPGLAGMFQIVIDMAMKASSKPGLVRFS